MKREKEYLIRIESGVGADLTIIANSDWGGRPFGVYYCGRDTGKRYSRIGDAVRYLKRVRAQWNANGCPAMKQYFGGVRHIPVHGIDPDVFRREFC